MFSKGFWESLTYLPRHPAGKISQIFQTLKQSLEVAERVSRIKTSTWGEFSYIHTHTALYTAKWFHLCLMDSFCRFEWSTYWSTLQWKLVKVEVTRGLIAGETPSGEWSPLIRYVIWQLKRGTSQGERKNRATDGMITGDKELLTDEAWWQTTTRCHRFEGARWNCLYTHTQTQRHTHTWMLFSTCVVTVLCEGRCLS